MAWADRIAYVCHDFEDAVSAGIVTRDELPGDVATVVGTDRRTQLHRLITAMIDTVAEAGVVGLRRSDADALDAFRVFNFDRIYLRPASVEQARRVIVLIRALTDWFIEHPENHRPSSRAPRMRSPPRSATSAG